MFVDNKAREQYSEGEQALEPHNSKQLRRKVDLLRWVFLTLVVLLVIAEPVSHIGLNHNWPDQSKFYEALNTALQGKPNPLVDKGWVGPGYVAAAVVLNRIVSIRPEDTLVLLNRLSFLGTVAVIAWLVLFLPRWREQDRKRDRIFTAIAGFVFLICVVDANGLTFFSDIPWSHFVASFLVVFTIAVVLVGCRRRSQRMKILLLIAGGMSLGLLTATRLFEGVVVAFALIFAYGLGVLYTEERRRAFRAFLAASFLVGLTATLGYAACLQLSGANQIALFYFSTGLSPVVAKIYPSTFPAKFFQIFVDPSFDTTRHSFVFRNAFQQTWSPSFAGWSMPLLLQSPILFYSLAILAPVTVVAFIFRSKDGSAEASTLRTALIVGIALLIGYTTSFVDGSPNLGSGMIRDYMPVIWCLALAGAPTISWLWIGRSSRRIPLILCGGCIAMMLLGESAAAFGFWPTDTSRHIARAIVTPACHNANCTLSLSYVNVKGQKWSETRDILLADIDCDGVEKRIALFGPNYRFHECPGAISGVVFPRLTGLGAQPIDNMPFGFTFRLPSPTAGRLSSTYVFGLGIATHSLLVKGWSANEHGFVWSDAGSAMIRIPPQPFKPGAIVKVDLAVSPFIFGSAKQQRVMIRVGNLPQKKFVLSKNLEDLVVSGVAVGNGDLIVSLKFPDAASPISVGLSPDSRLLAVQLRRITIYATP